MPTLGEELKRLREQRGISLAEISEATRIGTRFLKAIETDNFSVLPGGIFTRSFIRAFAKQVGMDEEHAILKYHQPASGVALEAVPPADPASGSVSPPEAKRPSVESQRAAPSEVSKTTPKPASAEKPGRKKSSTGETQASRPQQKTADD